MSLRSSAPSQPPAAAGGEGGGGEGRQRGERSDGVVAEEGAEHAVVATGTGRGRRRRQAAIWGGGGALEIWGAGQGHWRIEDGIEGTVAGGFLGENLYNRDSGLFRGHCCKQSEHTHLDSEWEKVKLRCSRYMIYDGGFWASLR